MDDKINKMKEYEEILAEILQLNPEEVRAYFIILKFKNISIPEIIEELKRQSAKFTRTSYMQSSNIKQMLIDKLIEKELIVSKKLEAGVVYDPTNPDEILDRCIGALKDKAQKINELKNLLYEEWESRKEKTSKIEKFFNFDDLKNILNDLAQYDKYLIKVLIFDNDFTWLKDNKWFVPKYGDKLKKIQIKSPVTIILCYLNSNETLDIPDNISYLITFDPYLRRPSGIKILDNNIFSFLSKVLEIGD